MRRVSGCFLEGLDHHFFYLGVVDAARRTGPGIVVEAVESAPGETVPPPRNPAAAHLRGDVHIGAAFGRSQHDTRPILTLVRCYAAVPPLQRLAFLFVQLDNHCFTTPLLLMRCSHH